MSLRPPTDSQWEAICAWDRHVLVEAGAGTGKTFTVVGRILFLLGVEIRGERHPSPVTLREIAAITFTRQAAADLKRDLRSALQASGLRREAYEVDQARIGTIHSFCSDIVHDSMLRTGRAPLTGVLEPGEALAWAEGCVRDELLAALEQRDVIALDALLTRWRVSDVQTMALRLMQADVLGRLDPADHEPHELALIELARRANRSLERRLVNEGRIDFDRMIAWTRDMLRHTAYGPAMRAQVQRRTHTLIIDEFQDTDRAQREIAYLIAEPESGRADTPRLMLVGDPKQSIYRFRGADVTVWTGVRRDFEERGWGRRLRLSDNFRSVQPILAAVETIAGAWLNTPVDGVALADHEVPFEPVDATRPDGNRAAVEVIAVPAGNDGKARGAQERRGMEAAAIARRMLELHAAGTPWRDMTLLLRSWTGVDIYTTALRQAGIPVYALRDDDFLETREVLDLVVALQAIRDPRDDLAVMGFLRSPFVSLRDDTLLAIAHTARRPYAFRLADMLGIRAGAGQSDAVDPGEQRLPEQELVRHGIALLLEFAELRDRVPVAMLLDELLHATGYMAHLARMGERGAQAALNVRRFLQMLGEMDEAGAGTVLRGIAERRGRKDRIPQARLHGEQDDVVLITSIHMAKGLDWSVVFYADIGAKSASNAERLLIGASCIRLKEPDTSPAEQTDRVKSVQEQIEQEEKAEEKRVTYVGTTRPKDLLILAGLPLGAAPLQPLAAQLFTALPAVAGAADGDVIHFTAPDGTDHRAIVRLAAEVPADTAAVTDTAMPAVDVAPTDSALLPPPAIITPLGLTRHSATELLTFSRCERRHALKYVHGIREPRPEPRAGEVKGGAVARGQIVHDVLERAPAPPARDEAEREIADEADAELDALLEDAIGRWDADAPPPDTEGGRRYRDELRDEIERVLAMPAYAHASGASGARRELHFLHVLDEDSALHGAMDLASPGPDGLTVLDVKTGRVSAGSAPGKADEYAAQRDVYVAAADKLSPLPVREFGFVFSAPAVSVTTSIEPGDAEAASHRVADTIARMGTVPYGMTSNARECFFCGYRPAGLCPGVKPA